jgi:hypothetical protein
MNVRYRRTHVPNPPSSFREEFRALLGVRKYPKNESSVLNWMLWGFRQRWGFGAGFDTEGWLVQVPHSNAVGFVVGFWW